MEGYTHRIISGRSQWKLNGKVVAVKNVPEHVLDSLKKLSPKKLSPKKSPPKKSPPKSPKRSPSKKSPKKVTSKEKELLTKVTDLNSPKNLIKLDAGTNYKPMGRGGFPDNAIALLKPNFADNVSLFGIFSGLDIVEKYKNEVAKYLTQNLGTELSNVRNTMSSQEVKKFIIEAFEKVGNGIKDANDAATAIIALIIDNKLYLAWTGNTKGCLIRNKRVILLTEAHTLNLKRERDRIQTSGGTIRHEKGERVEWFVDNIPTTKTREFGNTGNKYIITTPDVISTELQTGDIIMLATTGIWKYFDDNKTSAINVLYGKESPKNICKRLADNAYNANIRTDLTTIVIKV